MATGYNPYNVEATGYGTTSASSGSYTPATQASTGYSASTLDASGKASVTDNLTSLLDQNSPLMQRAAQRGLEVANQRGLLNSSIAAGASQASLYDVAVPLATSDAQLYSQNQQFNTGAINRAREFGAAAKNAALANDAAASNRAREFGAQAQNTASLANQQAANQAAAFAADAQNRASAANAANQNTAAQFTAEQQNREQLLQLENQNKISLANIEANFKNVIQTSASAQEVVKSYQAGVAQIQQNKDLDAPAKLRATQNLYESTKASLSVLGQISNLNLVGSFPALITN